MIKYRVIASKLSANPDGYVGRVTSRRAVDIEEIAAEVARLGTTVSEPDVLNVLNHYQDVVARMLLKGETVNTPAVRYRVSIQGTFVNQADSFDSTRHRLVVRLSAGRLLRKALRDARLDKYLGDMLVPKPVCYIDTSSGAQNGVVTPREQGRLIGEHLRFDPADVSQGIFFLTESGAETRVASVGLNRPGHLMFIVPELAAGRYRLEVRGPFNGNEGQEVRAGRLDAVLTVS